MSHPVKVDKKTFEKIKKISEKTGWSYAYIIRRVFEGIDVEKIPSKRYIIIIKTEGEVD